MDFNANNKRRNSRRSKNIDISYPNEQINEYPDRLLMYNNPPKEEISLEEFERFAVDRLKLLRDVENIAIRFNKGPERNQKMEHVLKEFLPSYFLDKDEPNVNNDFKIRSDKNVLMEIKKEKQVADRRKDHISHFILRLAFARSEDLRRWFLAQEVELFRFRFSLENTFANISSFLVHNHLKYEPISEEEEEASIMDKLAQTMQSINVTTDSSRIGYYKVPFTSVLDLVRSRRVFLHKGQAYVPTSELVSIISGIYRTKLSQTLALTARKLPYLEEDTRLLPLLKNLSSAYIGDSYTSKNTKNDQKLSLADIDEAAKISYPICMKNLHEGLRHDHHLKHFGRLQYGLFIKAAGLSLDEALMFWRTEFTKKMDVDKFEKQYAYNVRHSYGKEGKRTDYTPYNCMKIITSNQPGPGDFHGCPFKHSDGESLRRRLHSYKLTSDVVDDIVDLVKNQHYQVACSRYFESTHKLPDGTVSINHPNQYFDESRKVLSGGKPTSVTSTVAKEEVLMNDSVKRETPKVVKKESKLPDAPADVTIEDFDDQMDIL